MNLINIIQVFIEDNYMCWFEDIEAVKQMCVDMVNHYYDVTGEFLLTQDRKDFSLLHGTIGKEFSRDPNHICQSGKDAVKVIESQRKNQIESVEARFKGLEELRLGGAQMFDFGDGARMLSIPRNFGDPVDTPFDNAHYVGSAFVERKDNNNNKKSFYEGLKEKVPDLPEQVTGWFITAGKGVVTAKVISQKDSSKDIYGLLGVDGKDLNSHDNFIVGTKDYEEDGMFQFSFTTSGNENLTLKKLTGFKLETAVGGLFCLSRVFQGSCVITRVKTAKDGDFYMVDMGMDTKDFRKMCKKGLSVI